MIIRTGKVLVQVLKEAYTQAFSSASFSIVHKEMDSATKHATFFLKAKWIPTSIVLTTREIIHDDQYLSGLSSKDRKMIEEQYLSEIHQPLAYIEEYPIPSEEEHKNMFKIFILEEKKMVCGAATYFMEEDLKTLFMLSKPELLKIAMAYYMERFGPPEENVLSGLRGSGVKRKNNVIKLTKSDPS